MLQRLAAVCHKGCTTSRTVSPQASTLKQHADSCWAVQVIDDVREECGKCGVVVDVKVPRPKVPSNAAAEIGKNNFGLVRPCWLPVLVHFLRIVRAGLLAGLQLLCSARRRAHAGLALLAPCV